MSELSPFFWISGAIALGMLVWNTIEVGRNDATNIVNAVFGARVLRRKIAVRIAGIAVILGACVSSPVMETARKGIFEPAALSLPDALSIYLAVYLTNTVLLYSFSAFGMPISTTACLVFALLGSGLALGGSEVIYWDKSGEVVLAIVFSIFISGIASFLVQRAFRGAMGKHCDNPEQVRLHGPWIAGALLTGLVYFILMKGMKNLTLIQVIRINTIDELGAPIVLVILWFLLFALTWLILRLGGKIFYQHLFPGLAILGMIATAIAFGQNDLANCASPGLASLMILTHGEIASTIPVPWYLLLGCGFLLFVGMRTKNAQRVTRAAVNTGSQGDLVRLYAPQWCIRLAKLILPEPRLNQALAPVSESKANEKPKHYDALRAAVITSVSASVIAFASGMGLPVSTTYVAFAAVISTGWADRIFQRGDSHLKMGRTIWVVFCWFISALIAATTSGLCAKIISLTGTTGIVIALSLNLLIRKKMGERADRQEDRLIQETHRRREKLSTGESDLHPPSAADTDEEEI